MRVAQIRNTILRMLGCVLISTMIGTLIMIAVYLLPTEPMYRHVQESAERIALEGKSFSVASWAGNLEFIHTMTNPWSNHIMLMQAIYPRSDSAVQDAMLNRRWLYAKGDVNPSDTLFHILSGRTDEDVELDYQQYGDTDGTIDANSHSIIYPRYWHGYLVVLKPLLLATNVTGVRVINSYVLFVLMAAAIVLFYKKLGAIYAASFILVLLTLNPVTLAMAFQIDAVIYIMLLSVILTLWKNERLWESAHYPWLFLFIGIFTAFFDFLTFPLVGFGVPWLVYYVLNKRRLRHFDSLACLCNHVACWLLGYVGMWSGKWLVSWLLTGYNTMYDAYLNIGNRISHTGRGGQAIVPWEAVIENFVVFFHDPLLFVILIIFIYFVYHVIITKRLVIQNSTSIPFFIVAALPFLWYMALCNHSYVCVEETYRHLVVTEFAALCLFIENLRNKDGTMS